MRFVHLGMVPKILDVSVGRDLGGCQKTGQSLCLPQPRLLRPQAGPGVRGKARLSPREAEELLSGTPTNCVFSKKNEHFVECPKSIFHLFFCLIEGEFCHLCEDICSSVPC